MINSNSIVTALWFSCGKVNKQSWIRKSEEIIWKTQEKKYLEWKIYHNSSGNLRVEAINGDENGETSTELQKVNKNRFSTTHIRRYKNKTINQQNFLHLSYVAAQSSTSKHFPNPIRGKPAKQTVQ